MPYAETVGDYVDRHVAALVDAINCSLLQVRTFASCSGHGHKPGIPYVAFRCRGWDFLAAMLEYTSAVNLVTRGQTSVKLSGVADGTVSGSIRLGVYPHAWPSRRDWGPLFLDQVVPPRRLVRLWWAELAELARMVATGARAPSAEFIELFPSIPPRPAITTITARAAKDVRRLPTLLGAITSGGVRR